MDYADSMSNVVYRGHLGHYTFPGFQVYADYAGGGKTELVLLLL